jgi:hypothetical protein
MKSTRCFLLAFLTVCAVPAFADNACYAPEQTRAEQLLRLHSELMVITVTCRQGSDGQFLPAAYTSFTQKNIRALHDAEQTMIAYYAATKKGDPIEHLDRLRTLLSNEFGQKAAKLTAPNFCTLFRDKVAQFNAATPDILDNHIRRMTISERSYVKPCGKTVVAKKGG